MKSLKYIVLYKYGFNAVLILFILVNNIYAENKSLEIPDTHKSYIDSLVSTALKNELHNDIYWHTLLHYKKSGKGIKSLVDDPAFFLSDEGKKNSKKEMEATIRSFFTKPVDGTIHPTAKFTARFDWLSTKLNIDKTFLYYNGEEKFTEFYNSLSPSSITLVFPAGYMNSPASMYGHTLLIIESENQSRLMARAANYAAITDETFGPIFAFKGLFGIYKGYFSFLPYYQKIKEYSDGEMRDMWEYELNLNKEEIEKVVRHIVEIEDIYSDYYFADENCSFNLLYLLEVARPETALTDSFFWTVEPIDTLRVVDEKNFISNITYRPSLYSKIQHLKSFLSKEEQSIVLAICKGKMDISGLDKTNLSDTKKVIICDLAIEYLKFMAAKGDINQEDYRNRFLSVLTKRNSLNIDYAIPEIKTPVSPEKSHRSQRISAEAGYRMDQFFYSIAYRYTAHSLMDPDDGYNKNSQIVFGNIEARYYQRDNNFKLHRFDLIDLISLPASDRFFTSACWDFKTGFIQNTVEDRDILSYWIKGASGLSTLIGKNTQVYLMGGLKFFFASKYSNSTDFHAGAETGILLSLGSWKGHFFGNYYYVPAGFKRHVITTGFSERLKITQSVSLMTDYSYNRNMGHSWHHISLNFNLYF